MDVTVTPRKQQKQSNMKANFYLFRQNNSFGSFDVDDYVCHTLFIEAINVEQANKKAEELGVYFNGCEKGLDCPCCGDRWYKADDFDKIDLKTMSKAFEVRFETIESYAQFLANEYGGTTPEARVYYLSGKVVEINKTK